VLIFSGASQPAASTSSSAWQLPRAVPQRGAWWQPRHRGQGSKQGVKKLTQKLASRSLFLVRRSMRRS
jgi:hypothetical protein